MNPKCVLLSCAVAVTAIAASAQTRMQLGYWDFGPNAAGYTLNPSFSATVTLPVLTVGGGDLDANGADGVAYTDRRGVAHVAGQAVMWNDIQEGIQNAFWTVALDTRYWKTLLVQFHTKGNALSPVQAVRIEYSADGGNSWFTHIDPAPLGNNNTSFVLYTMPPATPFPAGCDNNFSVMLRFSNLDAGPANDEFSFDNFEVSGIRMAPTGVTAVPSTGPNVVVSWDPVWNATGYRVLRSTSLNGTYTVVQTITSGATTTWNNTGLSVNTRYYYKVRATFDGGTARISEDSPAVNALTPTAKPGQPTATLGNQPQVALSWTASAGALYYYIARGTSPGVGYAPVVGLSSVNSWTDTTVLDDTQYYYVVYSINADGFLSLLSTERAAKTRLGPPISVTATRTAPSSVTISWPAVTGATSYKVYRSTSPNGTWGTAIATKTAPTVTHIDPQATDFYYAITAISTPGESRFSMSATPCATAVPAPTSLSATPQNTPRVVLNWPSVPGATTYKVKRAPTSGGTFAQIDTTTTATYQDNSVSDGTTYYYAIVAANGGVCDGGSSPQARAILPPAPPTLTATLANGLVNLSWTAPASASAYNVKRATSINGPFVTVETRATTSYTDNPGGGNFFYRVTAMSATGLESRDSAVATVSISFLVLNEIKANPPGSFPSQPESPWEYIELRGIPGYNLAGHRVIVINGADGVGVGRGRAMLVVPLAGTVPASGIVTIRQGGHHGLVFNGLEFVVTPAQRVPQGVDNPNDELIINEASTIILAQGGTAPVVNTDYDTGNDGILDAATWDALNQVIVDSVGWFREPQVGQVDRLYANAPRLLQADGQPDAAARFPSRTTPNSVLDWYSGCIDADTGGSPALGYSADPTKRSANFPAGAPNSIFLTPGTPNEPNTTSPIGVIGPQSFVAWVSYFEQQNAPITFSLNGVASLEWDISDMEVLANDTDNWLNYVPQVNGNVGTFTMNPSRPFFNVLATFVPDGDWARARSFPMAGVIGGANSVFHGGVSDGSAAVPIAGNLILVGDDETNPIDIYDRSTNGLVLNSFDFAPSLNLAPPPAGQEVDIEAAATVFEGATQVTYWIGGHSNGPEQDGFDARPNRNRFFATTLTADTGVPNTTQLTFGDTVNNNRAYNASFRTALQAWQPGLRLAESMALGVDSKTAYGFNIEGLGLSYDQNTMYVAFRAPLVPAPAAGLPINDPTRGTLALIAPLTGFRGLIAGAQGTENGTLPAFGNPIQLDLGGRGVRAMRRGSVSGADWILAGLPTASRAPGAFALYLWGGGSTVLEHMVDLAGKNPEAIVEDFGTGIGGFYGQVGNKIRLIEDCGTVDWYNTGTQAKDFPINAWANYRRMHSDVITIGPWVNTPYIFNLVPNGINANGASEGFAVAEAHFTEVAQYAFVGRSDSAGGPANQVGFVSLSPWWAPAATSPLQSLSGNPNDCALGIYRDTHAAGYSLDASGNRRAVMWSLASGTIAQTIPTLGGPWNEARGININRNVLFWGLHVVGASQKASGVGAFLWNEYNSTYVWDLPGVAGSTYTVANAINSYGQIVGGSGTSPANLMACLWEQRDLWGIQQNVAVPVILGTFPNGGPSEALAINDNGTIVGYAFTNGVRHACLWARETSYYKIYDLGTHNVAANSAACGIAVSGQVVGWEDFGGITHGITWINGRWYDVNTRVPTTGTFTTANAVSGLGHITGAWKETPQSVSKAYLLISNNDDD